MKRTVIIAAMVVCLASCNKDNIERVNGGSTLKAVLPGVTTKTSVDGLDVYWTQGDKIAVVDGAKTIEFTATSSEQVTSIKSEERLSGSGTYYGIYPFDEDLGFSGGTFSTQALVNQHLTDAALTWDPLAPVMIGICDTQASEGNDVIAFQNAHALIKLILPCNAISATINAHSPLAGHYSASFASGYVQINPVSGETTNYVSLKGEMTGGNPYYIACIPKHSSKDLAIMIHYTEGNDPDGIINQQGMWYYNILERNIPAIDFDQNIITKLDLRGVDAALLTPTDDFNIEGNYLFYSDDGNGFFINLGTTGNSFKWADCQWTIYDFNDDNMVTLAGNGKNGTHAISWENAEVEEELIDGATYIYLTIHDPRINGSTVSGSYGLTLSNNHPGALKCVDGQGTAFAGFIMDI